MKQITPAASATQALAVAPKCGGCFKPVDPTVALTRPIYRPDPRRGRYTRTLAQPVVLYFCNADCRQRADNANHGNGGFRF